MRALKKFLEEKVINPLNRIEGIGSVGLSGTPKREIYRSGPGKKPKQ
jgi:HAE1 family hydrophobic/amphiphilic exporter-1